MKLLNAKSAAAKLDMPYGTFRAKYEDLGLIPLRLDPNSRKGLRWIESEIDAYLEARKAERDAYQKKLKSILDGQDERDVE